MRCSLVRPTAPVEKLTITGERASISRLYAAKTASSYEGCPSSLRPCTCTTVAPASYARRHSSPISTAVYGIAAHCFLVVTAPVTAHVTMTLSPRGIRILLGAPRLHGALNIQRNLAHQR